MKFLLAMVGGALLSTAFCALLVLVAGKATTAPLECRTSHWDLQGEIVRCEDEAAFCYMATYNGALSCVRK